MAKRYILIVSEGCGGCEEAKKQLESDARVEILDVTKSLYAADIIRQAGLFKVPLLVEVDDKEDKVCVLNEPKPVCIKESSLVRDNGGSPSGNV
jgi:hypothetical protein